MVAATELGRFSMKCKKHIPTLHPIQNTGLQGLGRAVVCGLDNFNGDTVEVMMTDESDDCRDVVRQWQKLNDGCNCVFGSRHIKGRGVID